MTLLDKIYRMEIEYIRNFSEIDEDQIKAVCKDNKIPDMYTHNYVFYKSMHGLQDYIITQLQQTKSFFNIRTSYKIDDELINNLPILPEKTIYEIYHIKTKEYKNINGKKECIVVMANHGQALEDGIICDIQANLEMGIEFARRRIKRKADEFSDDSKPIDFYVCYHNNIAIGNVEYGYTEDIVKIEDFEVLDQYQHQGFGSSIIKHLLEKAYNDNIEDAYLLTDNQDTAKEMYKKIGFNLVGEITELIFHKG